MQKILLIGNGPSALSRKLGKEIDEFPLVARFNTYRIKGYEEFVGTKTDYWITCDVHPRWQNEYRKIFLCSYNRRQDNHILIELRKKYPDCDHFPEWAWKETLEGIKFDAPSTGAVAATYFSKDHEVYIYGFDFFAGQKHHYGDGIDAGPNHSPKHEFEYFRKIIMDGKVIPFHDYLSDLNYDILHRVYPSYGVGGNWFRDEIIKIAKEYDVKTILDYGCGKGSLVKLLSNGYEAFGYDPYVDEYSKRPASTVDMVVSTDFFEHVGENEIDAAIADIKSYSPKVQFHAISNRKAAQILPDGTNAHNTVKDSEWWEEKLGVLGTVSVLGHNESNNFTMYIVVGL
ncbi:MAG: glycosyltransferase family 29 protein [Planctomycetes bacterium]|nr:glycosyltransferase family 29 protein [Planctomycetota bacterium]